jgi:hypothetical protein
VEVFIFISTPDLSSLGWSVEETDVLVNHMERDSMSMRGSVPWRAGREHSVAFFSMLFHALTKPQAVIVDAFASTGMVLFHIIVFHFAFLFQCHSP